MLNKNTRKPFVFKKVSDVDMRNHANGVKGSLFKPQYAVFRTKNDILYRLRFMPPTWDEPKYYGYEMRVHKNIGADKEKFICLEMNGESCPACAEAEALQKAGATDEEVKIFRAKTSFAFWVIQRGQEPKGPQLFVIDWMTDQNLVQLATDDETKEMLCPYNPNGGEDGGRDLSFTCKGQYKRMEGMKYATRSTPLSDDPKQYKQWIEYIQDNPIPNCLKFVDADYVAKIIGGMAGAETEETESEPAEEAPQTRNRANGGESSRPRLRPQTTELDLDDLL